MRRDAEEARDEDSSCIGWESLLRTDAPTGCRLKAALVTTYDQPDERFLAEEFLPTLLRLSHDPAGEGREHTAFLIELDRRLKELQGRLVLISSSSRDEPAADEEASTEPVGSTAFAWIWSSVRHFHVGRTQRAVQHAKLWMFHWSNPAVLADDDADAAEPTEYLEIVVSSANLTRAAFRSQLQGAWRVLLPLHKASSGARRASWGILPAFLDELARSAAAVPEVERFTALLGRASAPADATFIASVPGTHSRATLKKTPWGAAGLRDAAPGGRGHVKLSILAPYVGSFGDSETLERFCQSYEGQPSKLSLVWIKGHHPWARGKRWVLPRATAEGMAAQGVTFLELRQDTREPELTDAFHEEHRHTDPRWSHAKAYSFSRGRSERLVITSANFSQAAWGKEDDDGALAIQNFELGVSYAPARDAWPFSALEEVEDIEELHLSEQAPRSIPPTILWAQARWDGATIFIECRVAAGDPLIADVRFAGTTRNLPISEWRTDDGSATRTAEVVYARAEPTPAAVDLRSGGAQVTVTVLDERPAAEREAALPPDIDDALAQEILDDDLFAAFNGPARDDDVPEPRDADNEKGDGEDAGRDGAVEQDGPDFADGPENDDALVADGLDLDEDGVASRGDSYAVPAFVMARRYLACVDCWGQRMEHASKVDDDFEQALLRKDGRKLIEALMRRQLREEGRYRTAGLGPALAAEELTLRMKQTRPDERASATGVGVRAGGTR